MTGSVSLVSSPATASNTISGSFWKRNPNLERYRDPKVALKGIDAGEVQVGTLVVRREGFVLLKILFG